MTAVIQLDAGIQLLDGSMFDYMRPEDSEVTIETIGKALSHICRYAGHVPYFYSVAQHVVNTSYIVAPELAYCALLHDTAEAFTNDLPTPLKYAVPVFLELEKSIEAAMGKRFGFPYPFPPEVKLADLQMLKMEKAVFKPYSGHWSVLEGIHVDGLEDKVDLSPWSSEQAFDRFMARYQELAA